jgi:3-oxoacyl-[acyl-carrier-protein] synthase-1
MGIQSCIGTDLETVKQSLYNTTSGIKANPEYTERGMRSQISGSLALDTDRIDRKLMRFMGNAAAFAYLSAVDALADSGLNEEQISNIRTGIVAGSGGASSASQVEAADILRDKGVRRVGPYRVTQTMGSTVSACLATALKIKGVNYSISSACSTSAHCIGHGAELIQMGKQDVIIAAGGEEEHWTLSCLFDAMGALSSKYNDTPERASRAYDANRDGFVIAGGGGAVILEDLEHALARGATIYGELVGYGATSDGADMVAPSGEGAVRAMQLAASTVDGPIDYINAHGTSTPAGDITELNAVKETFGDNCPAVSSTKSLTGHSLGATGVQEAIYSLIMMRDGFIAGSANVEELDPGAEGVDVVSKTRDQQLTRVMSNSFGFGGTNASLVFQAYQG